MSIFTKYLLLSAICVELLHGKVPIQERSFDWYLSDDHINEINKLNSTWKAARNFPSEYSMSFFKSIINLQNQKARRSPRIYHVSTKDLPLEFDSRTQWPECPSISHVTNQGKLSCLKNEWNFHHQNLSVAINSGMRLMLGREHSVRVHRSAVYSFWWQNSGSDICLGPIDVL